MDNSQLKLTVSGELSKLKPNISERFLRFMEAAFNAGLHFGVHVESDEFVDITPIGHEEMDEGFRLFQLERIGVPFGVFRPAATFAKREMKRFSAYDIEPKLLKDRLSTISNV